MKTAFRSNGGVGRRWVTTAFAALVAASGASLASDAPVFREDFSDVQPGKPPSTFLILEGGFAVKSDRENRFLELPGAPLDGFAAMFGPSKKEDWGAQARFLATSQGRRFPAFGVSINGAGGYRIQITPAKKQLELFKGDDAVASAPFSWESGSWIQARIQIRKVDGPGWRIQGKAWKDGTPEPAAWAISWDEAEEPVSGRAAVWGKPFSGTPIRFDDLQVVTGITGP